jgi:hypothetical protein
VTYQRRRFAYCAACGDPKAPDHRQICDRRTCRVPRYRFCAYGGEALPQPQPIGLTTHLCERHVDVAVTDPACGRAEPYGTTSR